MAKKKSSRKKFERMASEPGGQKPATKAEIAKKKAMRELAKFAAGISKDKETKAQATSLAEAKKAKVVKAAKKKEADALTMPKRPKKKTFQQMAKIMNDREKAKREKEKRKK